MIRPKGRKQSVMMAFSGRPGIVILSYRLATRGYRAGFRRPLSAPALAGRSRRCRTGAQPSAAKGRASPRHGRFFPGSTGSDISQFRRDINEKCNYQRKSARTPLRRREIPRTFSARKTHRREHNLQSPRNRSPRYLRRNLAVNDHPPRTHARQKHRGQSGPRQSPGRARRAPLHRRLPRQNDRFRPPRLLERRRRAQFQTRRPLCSRNRQVV